MSEAPGRFQVVIFPRRDAKVDQVDDIGILPGSCLFIDPALSDLEERFVLLGDDQCLQLIDQVGLFRSIVNFTRPLDAVVQRPAIGPNRPLVIGGHLDQATGEYQRLL